MRGAPYWISAPGTPSPRQVQPPAPPKVFDPKLITVLREGYTWNLFRSDLVAGLVVGIVALPLAIAFAIASGVKPEQGLYTAIVAGFLISALGGSRVQVGGPTGAFVVLVYAVVQEHGYDGLVVATLLAGALLVVMGLARMGAVIKFIPYPVTVGFTSGIAVIIALGQVRDFLGLEMESVPAEFFSRLVALAAALGTFSPWALGIAVATVLTMRLLPRLSHRIPGSLVALLVTTAVVHLMDLPVDTIAGRFGEVPNSLPMPRLPHVEWATVHELFSPALAIALLAGIESLLSAVVADGMTGRRHRSNTELIAQGIANLVSPIFGGIPATGAIARTATNIKSGAKTPIAGIIHAITLLLILMVFGRYAGMIPMATLAGILMVVAWNMGEWHIFARLLRSPRSDVMVLLSTFGLTVVIDLAVAIQVGVVMAALLFMHRMSEVTQVKRQVDAMKLSAGDDDDASDPDRTSALDIPDGVEVFEVDGPFFFGAAETFRSAIAQIESPPTVLILRLRKVLTIDATGLAALEDVYEQTRRTGGTLVLSGIHAQPLVVIQRSGFLDRIGEANVPGDIHDSMRRARELLDA